MISSRGRGGSSAAPPFELRASPERLLAPPGRAMAPARHVALAEEPEDAVSEEGALSPFPPSCPLLAPPLPPLQSVPDKRARNRQGSALWPPGAAAACVAPARLQPLRSRPGNTSVVSYPTPQICPLCINELDETERAWLPCSCGCATRPAGPCAGSAAGWRCRHAACSSTHRPCWLQSPHHPPLPSPALPQLPAVPLLLRPTEDGVQQPLPKLPRGV